MGETSMGDFAPEPIQSPAEQMKQADLEMARTKISEDQKKINEIQAMPKKSFADGLKVASLYIDMALQQAKLAPRGMSKPG